MVSSIILPPDYKPSADGKKCEGVPLQIVIPVVFVGCLAIPWNAD